MKTDYREENNPKFNSLTKAIIHDSIHNKTINQFYGSNEELLDLTDFNEYGWEYIIRKNNLNNNDPLYYLDDSIKELLSNNLESIMDVRDSLFPTLLNRVNNKNISYFGSISMGFQKLIMLVIPSNYNEVYLCEFLKDTAEDYVIKFTFENKEILYRKLIWFVVTSGDETYVENINLSYLSWNNSNNPNRNLDNYLISTGFKFDDYNLCTKNDNNEWKDLSSNTILGNVDVIDHPILDNILKYCKNNIRSWNSKISYRKGQKIIYQNNTWISLSNNNKNNIPNLSTDWIIDENLIRYSEKGLLISRFKENGTETFNLVNSNSNIFMVYNNDNPIQLEIVLDKSIILNKDMVHNNSNILVDNILITKNNLDEINYNICKNNNKFTLTYPKNKLEKKDDIYELNLLISKYTCKLDKKYSGDNIEEKTFFKLLNTSNHEILEENLGNVINIIVDLAKINSYILKGIKETHLVNNIEKDSNIIPITSGNLIGNELVFNRLLNLPAEYNYQLILSSSIFTINLIEYIGFYIDTKELKCGTDETVEFRLYPINNNFNETIYISVNESNLSELMPIPEKEEFDKSKYISTINIDKTFISLSRFDENYDIVNYYRIIINDKKIHSNSKLNNNLNIKIWK